MNRGDKERRSIGSGELSSSGGRRPRPTLGHLIIVVAAAVAILTAGLAFGSDVIDHFSPEERETARLEVGEPVVSNPHYGESRAIDQEAAQGPTVAVTLRNLGSTTAWIEEARITIVEAARLAVCVVQGGGTGDVERTQDYRIRLPEFPGGGSQVVRRDLHVQVLPGEGVRPVLAFKRDAVDTTNLYAIAVEFVADPGGRVFDAGRFVIGVPVPVLRSGLSLPESRSILDDPAVVPGEARSAWCFRHNLAAMRRVLAEPGDRDPELRALAHLEVAPSWSAFASQSPARIAVEELLGSKVPEDMLYAVEAAEQTGDAGLEARTRRRAIAFLMRDARQALESYAPRALASVESVLSLGPSAAASRLLWRAKAAVSVEEEEEAAELAAELAAAG